MSLKHEVVGCAPQVSVDAEVQQSRRLADDGPHAHLGDPHLEAGPRRISVASLFIGYRPPLVQTPSVNDLTFTTEPLPSEEGNGVGKFVLKPRPELSCMCHARSTAGWWSGDTTPCRMIGVTLHSHVRYKETPVILHGVVSPEVGGSRKWIPPVVQTSTNPERW